MTVHTIKSPTPFQMASDFTFDGVTPFADAYTSRPSDAPDALDRALLNAPPARLCTAACTGTPTATRCRTWCCWTGKRACTSRSGTSSCTDRHG